MRGYCGVLCGDFLWLKTRQLFDFIFGFSRFGKISFPYFSMRGKGLTQGPKRVLKKCLTQQGTYLSG
jgi:hypothetical protein